MATAKPCLEKSKQINKQQPPHCVSFLLTTLTPILFPHFFPPSFASQKTPLHIHAFTFWGKERLGFVTH